MEIQRSLEMKSERRRERREEGVTKERETQRPKILIFPFDLRHRIPNRQQQGRDLGNCRNLNPNSYQLLPAGFLIIGITCLAATLSYLCPHSDIFTKINVSIELNCIASLMLAVLSSAASYMSPALSSQAGKNAAHGFGFANSGHKNNLRLFSSLQDFSSYHRLDPEAADLISEIDKSMTYTKPPLQRENVGSSFSKEKGLPGGTTFLLRKCIRLIMVFLCLLLFIFLTYMVCMYIYSNWSKGASKFYVVLDCGSTGTRVYIYQASIDHRNDGSLPIVMKSLTEGLSRKPSSQSGCAYDRMETEPGFHKLVHNKSGLKAAISPLISWAEKQIPEHAHKTTYLFLYATAGVRRLPSADSKWLLENA
ncbi:hypothetical protein CRYUN_Cryun19dG0165500 [Craigia yunnanensis]